MERRARRVERDDRGFAVEACTPRQHLGSDPTDRPTNRAIERVHPLTAIVESGIGCAVDGLDAVVDDEALLEAQENVRLVRRGPQVQLGLDEAAFESVAREGGEAAPVLEVVELGRAVATGAEPGRADLADDLALEKGDEAVEFGRQAFDLEGTAYLAGVEVNSAGPPASPGEFRADQFEKFPRLTSTRQLAGDGPAAAREREREREGTDSSNLTVTSYEFLPLRWTPTQVEPECSGPRARCGDGSSRDEKAASSDTNGSSASTFG